MASPDNNEAATFGKSSPTVRQGDTREEIRKQPIQPKHACAQPQACHRCYLLRSNLTDVDASTLWKHYIQLTDAEWAFRISKDELAIRPIWHQRKERVQAGSTAADEAPPVRHGPLSDLFKELPDPRVNRRRRHLFVEIIVIAVCAVIVGAETWKDMAIWGEARRHWLARFLDLPNGIPSRDTFRRVLCRIDPSAFQKCFLTWTASLARNTKGRLLHIDGKTLRRSARRKGDHPLHIVSVWASKNNLALGQTTVDGKSNEITAIPQLLEMLDLKGALVTIDAMGCQKEIARRIIEGKGDYCLAVKGNQEHLDEDIQQHFEEGLSSEFAGIKHQHCQTRDQGHGRREVRDYYLTDVPATLRTSAQWPGLKAVGMVISRREINGTEAGDTRYYILSFKNGKRFASAVRDHWSIENSLHWIMDVTFREDESRIQNELGASNFSWLRRFAISLLKNEPTRKDTVRAKKLRASWNTDYLLAVLLAAAPKNQAN